MLRKRASGRSPMSPRKLNRQFYRTTASTEEKREEELKSNALGIIRSYYVSLLISVFCENNKIYTACVHYLGNGCHVLCLILMDVLKMDELSHARLYFFYFL